ncbi:24980_t:CDS:2 [Dentiscutata erythropus]|uniref:24980_t:CDS:1 n=1 Tax=Dentiscutata erythropus TaxID=1348616 RepID=A0A9N9I4N2_9GLOM|nr:24980_t:CDS:2 [Dentiscutata erythropus]
MLCVQDYPHSQSICKKKDYLCVCVEDGTHYFCGPWALNVVDITPLEPRFTTLSIIIMVVG